MHPALLRVGSWTLSTYGVTLALAFLIVIRLAAHAAARSARPLGPLSAEELLDLGCWALVGSIIGGRLFYVIGNWDVYRVQPFEIVALWHGGLIWYGGFLGGVASTAWYLRRRGHAVWRGLDQVIPFVALGHAIGRIGCFLNGCCLGTPTRSWCGVLFPGHEVPLVPVQLIESVGLLALYVWLRRLQTASPARRAGWIFGAYLVAYGALRWALEYWRDQPQVVADLTLQQVISGALMIVGLWLLARRPAASSR